uniref:Pentatricopeptide repeat-containing protein At1g02370 isoform X2 n=1 Tax=Rhizophora mucronata TaxID=61149 RepID=A0A2P2IZP7_RHIMU
MAKQPNRLLSTGSCLARQLCTVAAEKLSKATLAAARSRGDPKKLYRRLSALGATGETVKKTLNEFVMEGNSVNKDKFVRCVKELRRYQKFEHALEVCYLNLEFKLSWACCFGFSIFQSKLTPQFYNFLAFLFGCGENRWRFAMKLQTCICLFH